MSRKRKIDGGFVVIPKNTIRSSEFKSLKVHARMVWIALLTEFVRNTKANPGNLVKMTHSQIEQVSGVKHVSVVRAMQTLKDKGFIKVVEQGGLLGKRSSVYQLNGRFLDYGGIECYW